MSGNPSFGRWLKQRRLELDLTHKELADRLACSVSLLRKYEGGLRRPPLRTAERLADLLAIPLLQRAEFLRLARGDEPAAPPPPATPARLPGSPPAPPNPLIGRERELALLRELLANHRMVTLVGPPGVGKTRLAQQAAIDAEVVRVCYVSLAPLADAGLVAPAIARALDVRERASTPLADLLKDALFAKLALLVLDNFEHVLDAAGLVAELVAACPQLTVIATSRTPLRLRAERVLRVPPLALPPSDTGDAASIGAAPAVALFVDRAQALEPYFALNDGNAAAIAAIARRVDGLPLAIELAAAQIERYAPADLLAELAPLFPLLADGPRDLPQRQQTMRAAVAWSYRLLDTDAQRLFRRLGVFSGGCTPEAARAICTPTAEGLDSALADLAERSLLVAVEVEGDDTRYTLLETLREFALERTDEAGEAAQTQAAHAVFYLALAEQAEQHLRGPDSARWLAALDADLDNLRAAMRWSHAHNGGGGAARIIVALMQFWRTRGLFAEAVRWAEPLLASEAGKRLAPALRARLLYTIGYLASQLGDLRAPAMLEESLALARATGDQLGVANTLNLLGMMARLPGSYERAAALHHESIAILRALDVPLALAASLNNLGLLLAQQADYAGAARRFREALDLARALGHDDGIVSWAPNLADALLRDGDDAQALALYRDALALARERGNPEGIAESLNGIGLIAYMRSDDGAARACFDESLALYRQLGFKFAVLQVLRNIGYLLLRQSRTDDAVAALRESLRLARETQYTEYLLHDIAGLAFVFARRGEAARAARLLAATEAQRTENGIRADAIYQALWHEANDAARAALDAKEYAAATAQGQRHSLEEAWADATPDEPGA